MADEKESSPQDHDLLVKKLLAGARQGDDLVSILQVERSHLAHCPRCQERGGRLLADLLGEDTALALALTWLEEMGQLQEPPSYPPLARALPNPPLWTSSRDASPQGIPGVVQELTAQVVLKAKVFAQRIEASLEGPSSGWPAWHPLAGAAVPARGRAGAPRGQRLSLPDADNNLSISLIVQPAGGGRTHLAVQVRRLEPDRLVERGQVALRGPAGSEIAPVKRGKASFAELDPGPYTIEVRLAEADQAERLWRCRLTLESAE